MTEEEYHALISRRPGRIHLALKSPHDPQLAELEQLARSQQEHNLMIQLFSRMTLRPSLIYCMDLLMFDILTWA